MAIDFEMTGINSDSPQYFDDLPFERYEKVFYFLLKFFFHFNNYLKFVPFQSIKAAK